VLSQGPGLALHCAAARNLRPDGETEKKEERAGSPLLSI
jgi:hypothetical protein